jgi:hypothetical protein
MVTGRTIVDDLPFDVDWFETGLGIGVGSLQGTLPLDDLPVSADDIVLPWRRVIWPCYKGVPQPPYVFKAEQPFKLSASNAVTFTAVRADAILAARKIWSTLVFVQQDQLDMARDLIAYALRRTLTHQAAGYPQPATTELPAAGSDIPWLLVDTATSGRLRDRLDDDDGYQRARDLTVADALTSLAQLQDGFEIRLDASRVAPISAQDSGLRATVKFGYPTIGRAYEVMPLEYPGNVIDAAWGQDGDGAESMSRVFGAGQGAQRTIGDPYVDQPMLDAGWPLLMGSETSSASEMPTLNSRAVARSAEHTLNTGWTFTLPEDQLGRYEVGDVANYAVTHRRWPGGRKGFVRIVGHRVAPGKPGRAGTVTPEVVEL